MWEILILKNTHYKRIKIEESREYKFFDHIKDFSNKILMIS